MKGFSYLSILALFLLSGCGGNSISRQLQSLSVSPTSATAQGGQAQFTATGQFNMPPMTVTPATVAWFPSFPVIDPLPSGFGYSLTSQPFTAQCLQPGPMTVTAIAPMDTNASANGVIPIPVFLDLVTNQKATQEGGFVAATSTLTCP